MTFCEIIMEFQNIIGPHELCCVSNHQPLSTSLALCEENPPVTSGFPSQRASNAVVHTMMSSSVHGLSIGINIYIITEMLIAFSVLILMHSLNLYIQKHFCNLCESLMLAGHKLKYGLMEDTDLPALHANNIIVTSHERNGVSNHR